MPIFEISLSREVTEYAVVEVEAPTAEDAQEILQKDLDGPCKFLWDVQWEQESYPGPIDILEVSAE